MSYKELEGKGLSKKEVNEFIKAEKKLFSKLIDVIMEHSEIIDCCEHCSCNASTDIIDLNLLHDKIRKILWEDD